MEENCSAGQNSELWRQEEEEEEENEEEQKMHEGNATLANNKKLIQVAV
jgi:hypothetical protein